MFEEERLHSAAQSAALDSETACLLRSFLVPAINAARDWHELTVKLHDMGYDLSFRDGRLIFKRANDGAEIGTGEFMGTPLRSLVDKLGRPSIRVSPDGHTGSLTV
ncbi:hypothetical protein [Aestuariivita boseongensis]|uniref:hypothetical protein n=1 Tax=Aestuariivita boseongensis TaxID=1470562 RepID=UPI0006809212|nr:hypothetical protein [Aestuariivita boseongensis]